MKKTYITVAREVQKINSARFETSQYLFLSPEEAVKSFDKLRDQLDLREWSDNLGTLLESMCSDNNGLVFNIMNSSNPATTLIAPQIQSGTELYRPLSLQEFQQLSGISMRRAYEKFDHSVDRKGNVREYA